MKFEAFSATQLRIRIQTTLRCQTQEPAEVLRQAITRGIETVTSPDREDAGLLRWRFESVRNTLADIVVEVQENSAANAEDIALSAVQRALNGVTNYLRTDDGLLSFSLTLLPILPAV